MIGPTTGDLVHSLYGANTKNNHNDNIPYMGLIIIIILIMIIIAGHVRGDKLQSCPIYGPNEITFIIINIWNALLTR